MSLSLIKQLIDILLTEMPEYRAQAAQVAAEQTAQRSLLRALMNVREPRPLSAEFLRLQDELLKAERDQRGTVDAMTLPAASADPRIALWQGDITRLAVDAIVNAANSRLLGCFIPCHRCIDNAIHTFAGMQLREKCNEIMKMQGFPEPAGKAKITPAYNLPSKFVIHTAGPVVSNKLTQKDCSLLKSCYVSCLNAAIENNLESIAFCCISTGEFHFPNEEAAHIAVQSVKEFKEKTSSKIRVIFNVFKDIDFEIYREVIGNEFIQ